jgi:hypothetical protein
LLASDDTFVFEAHTQTLTNKTLTSPVFNTGVSGTAVLDADDFTGASATTLATSESIKAYVDAQVGTVDTLAKVLANGNATDGTNVVVTAGDVITTDTISETTAAAGVTIDSVLLKDDGVNATNLEVTNIKANDGTAAGSIADSTGVMTIASSVLTTADINAGTIDGTVIGSTTPAAITGTAITATGIMTATGTSVFASLDISGDIDVAGTTNLDVVDIDGAVDMATTLTVAGNVDFNGDLDVDGTTNLDVVDIDGAVDMASTLTVTGVLTTTAATVFNGGFASNADSTLGTDKKVQFRDSAIYINSSADGQLDIVADTEIQIAATTIDVNGTLAFDSLKGTGATTVTNILDEHNMASDSATAIATQQSIKAYVDSQVGTVDTLSEILANGNTTGSTDIAVDSAQKVQFRDAAIYINSSVDGQLDIVADTEIQIAATTVDLNGNLDVSGTALVTGVLTTTAATVFNGGFASNADSTLGTDKKVQFRDSAIYINSSVDGQLDIVADTEIQIAATTIDIDGAINASGEIIAASLDVSGDIDVDGTTNLDVVDIDGAVDMASTLGVTGAATFSSVININSASYDNRQVGVDAGGFYIYNAADSRYDLQISDIGGLSTTPAAGGHAIFNEGGVDADFRVESDGNANALFVDGGNNSVGLFAGIGDTVNANLAVGLTGVVVAGDTDGATIGKASTVKLINSNNYSTTNAGVFLLGGGTGGAVGQISSGIGFFRESNLNWGTQLRFYVHETATSDIDMLQEVARFKSNEFVINETSHDYDFRVESDSNANMLFVDASANRVGVGISPTETLHVNGRSRIQNLYLGEISSNLDIVQATSSAGLYLVGGSSDVTIGTAGFIFNEGGADKDFRVESDTNDNMLFVDASTNYLCIGANVNRPDSSGSLSESHSFFEGKHYVYSTGDFGVWASNSAGTKFFFRDNTNTTIGSIAYDAGLASVTYNTTSDRRLKDNIETIADGTDKIMAMNPIKHTWKAKPDVPAVHGFIAQEMQEVVPEAVSGTPDGEEMMSMDYGRITPVLVAALQEAITKIETLESRITALES